MSETSIPKSEEVSPVAPQAAPRNEGLERWLQELFDPHRAGVCARLRRAETPLEQAMLPEVHRLQLLLGRSSTTDRHFDPRVGGIAHLMAQLKRSPDQLPGSHKSFAKVAAEPDDGHKPHVSTLRFRRLLQKEDDELLLTLRRCLPLVGEFDRVQLMRDLYHWNDQVRRQWATDYFSNLSES
ncbi:MAG: type I-E CRISPR-associated protein Cse2/CasB [Myxococcota bacterium]